MSIRRVIATVATSALIASGLVAGTALGAIAAPTSIGGHGQTSFAPGRYIVTLVDAFGPQRLSTIAIPGTPSLARQQELGVARVSFGPLSQNVALTPLAELAEEVQRGGGVPRTMRILN